jgi:PAS domain S-box-containing protein
LNNKALIAKASTCNLDIELLTKILDNSHEEVFVLDRNNYVIYVNSVCERHYGVSALELIGKSVYDLNKLGYWYPSLISIVREEKRRVTHEQTTHLGWKLITTVTPVFDQKGDIELIVYNALDITQLEAIKQELEKTQRALAEARNCSSDDKYSCSIVTNNPKMKELIEYAERIAKVDSNVLINGESGTGKGLFAKHIHKSGRRKDGAFLAINCAAIPEDLLESELFGYVEGAFTGARKGGKKGLIESANNGLLFLDEIGDLSPRLQAKILQVIQDQQYFPIGSTEIKQANVRIISATNRNLIEMVKKGKFRKDLYYRLNVIQITIPPLRERPEDIEPLVYYYNSKICQKYGVCHDISKEVMNVLCRYNWPGNVRELENLIERLAVTIQDTEIKPRHLPEFQGQVFDEENNNSINLNALLPPNHSFDSFIEGTEKELITYYFGIFGSSRKVAKALRISNTKAARLIRKYT